VIGSQRPVADDGECRGPTCPARSNGVQFCATSVFFALVLTVEVDAPPAVPNPGEIITESRWWHPEALAGVPLSNPELPEIVRSAVRSL